MTEATEKVETIDVSAGLPPQSKKGVVARGYCVVVNHTDRDLFPKQTCTWGRRRLRRGENAVNKNLLDDWLEHDPEFAALLKAGSVEIGRDFEPVIERFAQDETNKGGDAAKIATLEARLAEQERKIDALLEALSAPAETPKKGK